MKCVAHKALPRQHRRSRSRKFIILSDISLRKEVKCLVENEYRKEEAFSNDDPGRREGSKIMGGLTRQVLKNVSIKIKTVLRGPACFLISPVALLKGRMVWCETDEIGETS